MDYHREEILTSSFFTERRASALPQPNEIRALNSKSGDPYAENFSRPPPIRIPSLGLLVKYGGDVTVLEARTQMTIREKLLGRVPIPEVFGWTVDGSQGFIYMQLIEGETLQDQWHIIDEEDRRAICAELRRMVDCWRRLSQDDHDHYVGSLFKMSLNDIFLKHHPELVGPFEGPDAIEQFQRACDLFISQRTPIVFTHGDLVAPNILLLSGPKPGVAAVIDWAQAGEQENSDPHVTVAIIGAGMSGLLLCQALCRKGVDAQVYERASSADARFEGYRLGLSEVAEDALRRSISTESWESFDRLSERREGIGGLTIIDPSTCDVIWDWTKFSDEPKPRIIPRSILRELLVTDLTVNYSKSFQSFETQSVNGRRTARVKFEDGSSISCDLVVGADGSNSTVKSALRLDNKLDTNVHSIMMFAKGSEELVRSMPGHFVTRYWMVTLKRFSIFISTWLPEKEGARKEQNGSGSTNQRAINLDTVDWASSNVALGIFAHHKEYDGYLPADQHDDLSKQELKECFLKILENEGADKRLFALVQGAVEQTAQVVKFRSCTRPSKDWFESQKDIPVVLVGDALHSMPPTRGMGGNLALADAADLSDRITAYMNTDRVDDLTSGLAGFYEQISNRSFEMVGSSVFWARQYIHGGKIFHTYDMAKTSGRAEMEKDPRFGFADNASVEAVHGLCLPPGA